MKIAVTGGTGFIGRRVVRMLREASHEVRCVVRNPERAGELSKLGVALVQGDILDRPGLDRAFAGVDAVMHLAASYVIGLSGRRADEAMHRNVEGTRIALEAARDSGARRIVYTSSYVVFGSTDGKDLDESARPGPFTMPWPHTSTYMVSKARAHFEVAVPMMQAGAPIIAVLPAEVLGPGDHSGMNEMFRYLARDLPVVVGGAKYGVVGVEDCARGHLLALEKGAVGQSYLLCSENLSLVELFRAAAAASGLQGRAGVLPDWWLRTHVALAQLLERVVPLPRLMASETMRGMLSRVSFTVDSRRARDELGWAPTPLEATLREVMAYERARAGKPLPPLLESVVPRL